jgi:hypothetical protein
MRQQNMVVSSVVLGSESDCYGKAQKQCMSKLQTHPLVREDAPNQETSIVRQKTKIYSWAQDRSPTPRQPGRLTVGRNLTTT